MKNNKVIVAVSTLLSSMIPALSYSVVPVAMLEKSATYALDNSVHAFRVPTVDSTGKIKFYDAVIDLTVNADGTLGSTATVTSNLSPNVVTGVIQPGTYQETGGTDKCTVTNLNLTNGRIQSLFKCTNGAVTFEFSVATGQVNAGHPFLAELLLKKVNTRTDVTTQTWGIITNSPSFAIGGCAFGGGNGTAIGTKTNGNVITVNVISNSAAPNTFCAPTLNKLP